MKPMLAAKFNNFTAEINQINFPLIASPKLDGIRALIIKGGVYSRTLKPIPNEYVQRTFGCLRELEGLDGELIVGDPNAKDVYNQTVSGVMRIAGEPDVQFYVFDRFDMPPNTPYTKRLESLKLRFTDVIIHETRVINTKVELLAYEEECLDAGYEGVMLRSPDGPYKEGRATLREQHLIKLKRFEDSEAEIIDAFEEMENQNVKVRNELGRGQRSTHKANMVGKGTLGGMNVRDIHSGIEFSIGSGFNAEERKHLWQIRELIIGNIIKYKHFAIGVKDKPRFPTFLGWRDKRDISK